MDTTNDWRFEATSGPYSNTSQQEAASAEVGNFHHHRPHHQHRVLRSSSPTIANEVDEEEEDILHRRRNAEQEDEDSDDDDNDEEDDEDDEDDEDEEDEDDDLFASTLGSDFLDLFAQNGMMGNEDDEEDEGGCSPNPANVLPHGAMMGGGGSGGLGSMKGGPTMVGNLMSLSPRPASSGPSMNLMATSNSIARSSPSGRNSAGRRATTAAHTFS